MTGDWPFEDPPNLAVFATRGVMDGGRPILTAHYYDDDGSWFFSEGGEPSTEGILLVALHEVVGICPDVLSLVDPPLGWSAWRTSVAEPWRRAPDPDAEGE